MAGHHHEVEITEEHYQIKPGARKNALIAIGIGVVLLIAGVVLLAVLGEGHEVEQGAAEHGAHGDGHHGFHWTHRLWANLWLNSVFFTGITVISVFFIAFNYVANAGWSSSIKRVPEAIGGFLPYAGVALLTTLILGYHDLFHWTHGYLYEPTLEDGSANPEYDEILVGKRAYLNVPFFFVRTVVYFAIWYLLYRVLRQASLNEDQIGGTTNYYKSIRYSAIFLVLFAVTSSTAAWDWVMSIDPHWFSTLFGWYMFSSWFVAGLATVTLATVLLKEAGYLKMVNANHLHDMGKFMFAFSIFWTYLWFSQFLLIYYANIPEETIYFLERKEGFGGHYTALFYANLIINFFIPFLVLMTRESKRQLSFLKVVSGIIILGHWLDFYLMIMPGTLKENSGFGLIEFGTVAMFAGLFVFVLQRSLTKASLIPTKHPMIKESAYHDI